MCVAVFVLYRSPISRPSSPVGTIQPVKFTGDIEPIRSFFIDNRNQLMVSGGREMCPELSVQKERMTVKLTDAQIMQLINTYNPGTLLTSDVTVWFDGGDVYGATTSFNPLLPGEIRVKAAISGYWFDIVEAYTGQIQLPEDITAEVNRRVVDLFYRYLSSVGINEIYIMNIEGDTLTIDVEAPVGLLNYADGQLTIDADIMAQVQADWASCDVNGNGQQDDFRIQGS